MTKKQGLALPAGIYKIFWKRGGWSWATIGTTVYLFKTGKHGWPRIAGFDRDIMAVNWSGSLKGSRVWRTITKVERAPLAKMRGER